MEHLLHGSCHCGAVQLRLPHLPSRATECNCSICRRLGALWGVFDWTTVGLSAEPRALEEYIWGEKTLRTMRCRVCGCATHWEPLRPQPDAWHGVNLRMFPPELLQHVQIRRFDGADSWTFIDD
ncbi:GFA family protein [Roseateles depolymerans]|uniref:GFA family protein n=1 Tax=Roseateles depolymerans TaxID=76731 RepID=UPI000E3A0705|nr:hypothetical protein DES44_0759 [Roseateles depolymerans]